MQEIGVGILGFGLGTKVFHAPFVRAVPGLQLRSIVQRTGDSAAKAYPEAEILRSADELFARPEIDLVVVSTPNETHFQLARQALEAGKHVVIDKPFTSSSAEARELIEVAQEMGLVLAPFHNRRWDGDFLTVRKLLAEQRLGRVVTIESHFDRFRPLQRPRTWKESGNPANGLLMDLGPHLLDQAVALFGLPSTITASVRTDRDHTEIEDAFDIALGYKDMLYLCRASMLAADASPRFLVHGTLGSFKKFGLDPQEPTLLAGASVPPLGDPTPWLEEDYSAWGTLTASPDPLEPAELTRTVIQTERGDYRPFYVSVRDAINGTAELAISAETGFEIVRLLELARLSSEQGRTQDV